MGLFSWFQKGGEQVDKITDAVVKSGDALFYTAEEKEENAAKRRDLYFKFLELSRDENSIKSVTRRVLAFTVIGLWALMLLMTLGLAIGNQMEKAEFVLGLMSDNFWFTFAVGSFYFGADIVRSIKK
jgi:hypothetical protein